jgi:hypothetical protein
MNETLSSSTELTINSLIDAFKKIQENSLSEEEANKMLKEYYTYIEEQKK